MMLMQMTPTQREIADRSRAFHAAIAASAVTQKQPAERTFAVKGHYSPPAPKAAHELPPQAFPAEPDPPKLAPPLTWTPSLRPKIADIQAAVCSFYNVSLLHLLGNRGTRSITIPRHVAMYLACALSYRSTLELGRRFKRNHTVIIFANCKIARLVLEDEDIAHEVAVLVQMITGSNENVMGPMTSRSKRGPKTLYANIYPPFAGSCGHVYDSKGLADQMAARGRIACVPFTVELEESPDAACDEA